jgi:hypothetical protein
MAGKRMTFNSRQISANFPDRAAPPVKENPGGWQGRPGDLKRYRVAEKNPRCPDDKGQVLRHRKFEDEEFRFAEEVLTTRVLPGQQF